MGHTNVELEAQLEALTEICCEALKGETDIDPKRVEQLAKALLKSGYERGDHKPLSAELEQRVRERCKEPAIHRGAEIKSITEAVQAEYDKAVRWQSEQPQSGDGAKSANISSATDS